MTDTNRPAPFFIADHVALDILNSIACPNDTEFEWLGNGHDLINWLEHARLVTKKELKHLRSADQRATCDEIATEICALREWFREFVSVHAGQPLDTSTLKKLSPLNKILAAGNNYKQIELRESEQTTAGDNNLNLKWQRYRHRLNPSDLLPLIAEIMGDLICQTDFSLVKNCEGPTCTLWFYDISKNHSRRWCTMSICGNRVKAALHRAKKKASKNKSASRLN